MPDSKPKDVQVRPFADFFLDHNRGATAAEASEKLHELVARVRDTGRKGILTLQLSVDPMKGDTDTLLVLIDVKAKLPEFDKKSTVFFADGDGNLVRDNPKQPHLPLKVAGADDGEPTELKTVGGGK